MRTQLLIRINKQVGCVPTTNGDYTTGETLHDPCVHFSICTKDGTFLPVFSPLRVVTFTLYPVHWVGTDPEFLLTPSRVIYFPFVP